MQQQDAFYRMSQKGEQNGMYGPSDFSACPIKAKGDKEHGEEERKKCISYTSKYKIIVAGFMSDRKKKL